MQIIANKPRPDISIVCIAKDEAPKLKLHIPVWKTICNDIVIVDTGSTDSSIEIFKELGCRVNSSPWLGYGKTKNFGNTLAANNWILSLDADELPNEDLIAQIQGLVLQDHTAYKLNFHTAIGSYFIDHCGWHPLYLSRLFNRNDFQWNKSIVHEKLVPNKECRTLKLAGKVKHFSFDDWQDFYQKQSHYAHLKAASWIQNGKRPSVFRRFFGPIARFLTGYVYKLGFLDGLNGLKVCLGEATMVKQQIIAYEKLKLQKANR